MATNVIAKVISSRSVGLSLGLTLESPGWGDLQSTGAWNPPPEMQISLVWGSLAK